jgi:hypothetical protein
MDAMEHMSSVWNTSQKLTTPLEGEIHGAH